MEHFSLQGSVIGPFHSVLGQKMPLSAHAQGILVFPQQNEVSNRLGKEFWNHISLKTLSEKSERTEEGAGIAFQLILKKTFEYKKDFINKSANLAFSEAS